MYCPKCGAPLNGAPAFCPNCGAPLSQNAQQQNGNYYRQDPNPQGGYYPQNNRPTGFCAPIAPRDIALCVVLSIITCGIYGIYWFVCLVNDLNTAAGTEQDSTGGVVFLLSIVTCGIYGMYWAYKAGEKVNRIHARCGEMTDSSNAVLYLVLSIFGLGIVTYCLIQSELNKVATPRS